LLNEAALRAHFYTVVQLDGKAHVLGHLRRKDPNDWKDEDRSKSDNSCKQMEEQPKEQPVHA
jgi:hypothetical protein